MKSVRHWKRGSRSVGRFRFAALSTACLLAWSVGMTSAVGTPTSSPRALSSQSSALSPSWHVVWTDGFDGPAGVAPPGWQVSAPQWGSAYQSGNGVMVVPVGANMFRSAAINYPSGARLALATSVLAPSTSNNLAGVFMRHHDRAPEAEIDVFESYGPNRTGGKKKTQVATHQCYTGSCVSDWTERTDTNFSLGSKPWDANYRYQAEWTVASTYNVIFAAYDGSLNLKYQINLPPGPIARVEANRDYFPTVSNKYQPSGGGTRSEMYVDWIQLLAYY